MLAGSLLVRVLLEVAYRVPPTVFSMTSFLVSAASESAILLV